MAVFYGDSSFSSYLFIIVGAPNVQVPEVPHHQVSPEARPEVVRDDNFWGCYMRK